jgi:hypothetical protein
MSIVGNIECNGLAQVFGRIEGQLSASDLLISDGAHVEGRLLSDRISSEWEPPIGEVTTIGLELAEQVFRCTGDGRWS